MNAYLSVALGGAVGAALRHGAGQWVAAPWGTLSVNILGSFLMGALVGTLATHHETHRLLLGVGLLGGFTTFSAFSLDAIRLLEAKQFGLFALYVGGSVAVSLVALLAGLFLARSFA